MKLNQQILANLKKEIEAKTELLFEQAVINLVDNIIELSPVGKPDEWERPPPKDYAEGHYVANWQLVENISDAKEIDDIDPDKKYTKAKLHGQVRDLVKAKKLKKFRIVNTAPYADRIEYENWAKHNSPPGAVMALSMQNWSTHIADAKKMVDSL